MDNEQVTQTGVFTEDYYNSLSSDPNAPFSPPPENDTPKPETLRRKALHTLNSVLDEICHNNGRINRRAVNQLPVTLLTFTLGKVLPDSLFRSVEVPDEERPMRLGVVGYKPDQI